jgi:predicted transposase YdaD
MSASRHDPSYKALFSEPRMVEDLLRGFVPGEWVHRLDFSTLEKANAQFVSEELLRREDDVIWRVRFTDQGWLYVYLLLEFQSAPDPWMALRIMVYVGLLWQDLV